MAIYYKEYASLQNPLVDIESTITAVPLGNFSIRFESFCGACLKDTHDSQLATHSTSPAVTAHAEVAKKHIQAAISSKAIRRFIDNSPLFQFS